jgi:hypothetical protein
MKINNPFLDQIQSRVANNYFPLYAPVTKDGWFNLDALNQFCESQLDQIVEREFCKNDKNITYLLEFQAVRMWDISALLWLSIALQYYRKQGLRFKIHLPDVKGDLDEYQYKSAAKSADFLRRWNFDIALSHIDKLDRVLVPEQVEYFENNKLLHYRESDQVYSIDGKFEKPLTNKLLSIRDLSTFADEPGQGIISGKKIEDCIVEFHDINVGNILFNQCGLSKEDTESFADHLVGESLLNMKQHPDATSGFLAISRLGSSDKLILVVVDNGESIQSTITDVYNEKNGKNINKKVLPEGVDWEVRADMLHFATQPFVSSKPTTPGIEIGMGLTYIKEDTVDNFKGDFTIISESVIATYKEDSKRHPCISSWNHKWKGNLLRISIPIK